MGQSKEFKTTFKVHPQLTEELGSYKYARSFEPLNEIINNSLDSKPRIIDINVREDELVVTDDGIGMDRGVIIDKYLFISKPNLDETKRGMFGIGKFGCQALSETTEVITRPANSDKYYQFTIHWRDVLKHECIDDYEITITENPKTDKANGTTVRLKDLKREIDPGELREYLEKKHYPLLLNPKNRTAIIVNGKRCEVKEPEEAEVYVINSEEPFELNGKSLPSFFDFGAVTGKAFFIKKR